MRLAVRGREEVAAYAGGHAAGAERLHPLPGWPHQCSTSLMLGRRVARPVISRANSNHYVWGIGWDGWRLVKNEAVSVIEERIPPRRHESPHKHLRARQFFYVIRGEAVLEVDGQRHRFLPCQGLEVAPGNGHTLRNEADADLEFLVVSWPPKTGDRVPAR